MKNTAKSEALAVLTRHGTGLHADLVHKIMADVYGVTFAQSTVCKALYSLEHEGKIVRVAPGAYMVLGGHR